MGWRWKAGFLAAMIALPVAGILLVSHMSRISESAEESKSVLGRIVSAPQDVSIDSLGRLLAAGRDCLLPTDFLLARLHLAKIAVDSNDIFRLIDSARILGAAPPESLDAWRMLPYEASMSRTMALLEAPEMDLSAIARLADSCLARDSTLLGCHVAGSLSAILDRNWRDLGRRTDRALRIHPGDFRLQGFHGIGLMVDGDPARARKWIPDTRYHGSDGTPCGKLWSWSARMFRSWREAAAGTATDSFCDRYEIPDSIRTRIESYRTEGSMETPPADGFVSCIVAAPTHGAIHVCRPQDANAAFPQLGSDTADPSRSKGSR